MYEHHFENLDGSLVAWGAAADAAASAYLDGKPRTRGKHKITVAQRDAAFWACPAWLQAPPACWSGEAMGLALVRYFSQEAVSHPTLLARAANAWPDVIALAVRRSRLVVRPASARRAELDALGARSAELAELSRVLDIFDDAHRVRVEEVVRCQGPLAALTAFELLTLISLYAFAHLVPASMAAASRDEATRAQEQAVWHTMNDILWWKLSSSPPASLRLDDSEIGRTLSRHLAPLLDGMDRFDPARTALAELIAAQCELGAFMSRSVDAFCFDDSIRFVRKGSVLEIEEIDAGARAVWMRDGRKLERLHEYWFYRALDAFAASPMATAAIGRPENHEANRLAYIRALRTRMQLTDVYGVDQRVTTDGEDPVDLFQALLASELNSAFFQRDFLEVYMGHLRAEGDWALALRRLVEGGFTQGWQNRLPITWSSRGDKVRNLVGWTVTEHEPQGSALVAGRILDFWSSDWQALAERAHNPSASGPRPELFERPYLKFGAMLVQLPWLAGVQNNSTAALNNLRRLGSGRGEARAETARIEERLAAALAARGFEVVLNWHPPRIADGDAGEIDVICARDGVVWVIEVKSTFLRMSQREAWAHATSTLRKAGRQLRRKVAAVRAALASDAAWGEAGGGAGEPLSRRLGLSSDAVAPELHGWIVDTSIECDHQHFSGFLKVSLEEVLIALRDDAHLLHDPEGLVSQAADRGARRAGAAKPVQTGRPGSLYPAGFSAQRFLAVIDAQAVWAGI
jgi:Holliday junction resolvase-like predicted endonuclease